jgi:hypothetical protein
MKTDKTDVTHGALSPIQKRKGAIVDDLLANPVYMPESGLVQHLRRALLRLPVWQLENLQLIIEQKLRANNP